MPGQAGMIGANRAEKFKVHLPLDSHHNRFLKPSRALHDGNASVCQKDVAG